MFGTKIVELIGVSGAGKSYLLNNLQLRGRKKWMLFEEAIINVAKKTNPTKFHHFIYYVLINSNLLKRKELGLSFRILKRKDLKLENIEPRYSYLLKNYLKFIFNDDTFTYSKKYNLLNWYKKVILDLNLIENSRFNGTVVLDEGPVANNWGLYKMSIQEINDSVYLPSGIIFCSVDDKLVVERLKKRKMIKGKYGGGYDYVPEKSIKRLVKDRIYYHRMTVENYKKLNVPVYTLNVDDELTNEQYNHINIWIDNL